MEFQREVKIIFNVEEMNKFNDFYDLIIEMKQKTTNEDKELCEILNNITINLDDLEDYIED